jgi:hypothetical protein
MHASCHLEALILRMRLCGHGYPHKPQDRTDAWLHEVTVLRSTISSSYQALAAQAERLGAAWNKEVYPAGGKEVYPAGVAQAVTQIM